MKILVGDETGLIKWVSFEENKIISKFGQQEKESSVNFIEYLNPPNEVVLILIMI